MKKLRRWLSFKKNNNLERKPSTTSASSTERSVHVPQDSDLASQDQQQQQQQQQQNNHEQQKDLDDILSQRREEIKNTKPDMSQQQHGHMDGMKEEEEEDDDDDDDAPIVYDEGDRVVNYNDAVIYGFDLAILENDTAWLNDACVWYALTELEHQSKRFKKYKCVDPSVISYLMHQCHEQDELADFQRSFDMKRKYKFILPINDSMAPNDMWYDDNNGGTHWSLLLIIIDAEKEQFNCWHFDSMATSNEVAAREVAKKFHSTLYEDKASYDGLVAAKTPQQGNGYDCGLHMLQAARLFVKVESMKIEDYEAALQDHVTKNPNFALELRKELAINIRNHAEGPFGR